MHTKDAPLPLAALAALCSDDGPCKSYKAITTEDEGLRNYLATVMPLLDRWDGVTPLGVSSKMDDYGEVIGKAMTLMGRTELPAMRFAVLPTVDVNGHAERTEHGYLCILNRGLIRLLHHLSLAAYVQLYAVDENNELLPEKDPAADEAAFEAARRYARQFIEEKSHALHYEPRFRLSQEGIVEANMLGAAMKLFVAAHEASHVILGHTDNPQLAPQEEFEADALAQEILVTIDEHKLWSFPVVCGGISLLLTLWFMYLELKHSFKPDFNIYEPTPDHPPAPRRVLALDKLLQTLLPTRGMNREGLAPCRLLQNLVLRMTTTENRSAVESNQS